MIEELIKKCPPFIEWFVNSHLTQKAFIVLNDLESSGLSWPEYCPATGVDSPSQVITDWRSDAKQEPHYEHQKTKETYILKAEFR